MNQGKPTSTEVGAGSPGDGILGGTPVFEKRAAGKCLKGFPPQIRVPAEQAQYKDPLTLDLTSRNALKMAKNSPENSQEQLSPISHQICIKCRFACIQSILVLFYVFCELDFDKILLLQTASQPKPQSQITWKMHQKPIFPFITTNWNLYVHCKPHSSLLSRQVPWQLTLGRWLQGPPHASDCWVGGMRP